MTDARRAHPGGPQPAGGGADRRMWDRAHWNLDALCVLDTAHGEVLWNAQVRDVSRGGVCLILHRALDAGTRLRVELRRGGRTLLSPRWAGVLRTHAHVSGEWLSGCEFDQPLGEEEFQALRSSDPPGASAVPGSG